jgi:hypothetical protein
MVGDRYEGYGTCGYQSQRLMKCARCGDVHNCCPPYRPPIETFRPIPVTRAISCDPRTEGG